MARLALVLVLLLAGAAARAQLPAEIVPPSLAQQAAKAEREGDVKSAVRLYAQAARAGDGKAAYRLGEIYDKGLGDVPANYQESLKWFNAARVLGHPPLIGDFPSRRDTAPRPR